MCVLVSEDLDGLFELVDPGGNACEAAGGLGKCRERPSTIERARSAFQFERPGEPTLSFAPVSALEPVRSHGPGEQDGPLPVPAGEDLLEHCSYVVVLAVECGHLLADGRSEELAAAYGAGKVDEVFQLPHADLIRFTRLAELLGCVLSNGFEHAVPGRVTAMIGSYERGADEARDRPDHGIRRAVISGDDRISAGEREACRKDGKPAECHALRIGEEGVAPFDRGAQCTLALRETFVGRDSCRSQRRSSARASLETEGA